MIYKCENCKNRHDCCENKEQYERTCKTVGDIARAIDKTPDYHCYYSLTIKCDYFVDDKETYAQTFAQSTGEIKFNPKWRENKNVCCFFCGETRSVKYLVDLHNHNGERALTVDCCNRCVLLLEQKGGEAE